MVTEASPTLVDSLGQEMPPHQERLVCVNKEQLLLGLLTWRNPHKEGLKQNVFGAWQLMAKRTTFCMLAGPLRIRAVSECMGHQVETKVLRLVMSG